MRIILSVSCLVALAVGMACVVTAGLLAACEQTPDAVRYEPRVVRPATTRPTTKPADEFRLYEMIYGPPQMWWV